MAFIVAGTGAYALSRFADQAFADSLGLRTVRVGTDPLTWASSHLVGFSGFKEKPRYVSNMTDEYGVDFVKLFCYNRCRINQKNPKFFPGMVPNHRIHCSAMGIA